MKTLGAENAQQICNTLIAEVARQKVLANFIGRAGANNLYRITDSWDVENLQTAKGVIVVETLADLPAHLESDAHTLLLKEPLTEEQLESVRETIKANATNKVIFLNIPAQEQKSEVSHGGTLR